MNKRERKEFIGAISTMILISVVALITIIKVIYDIF